jgi:hypothetical protein
MAKFLVTYPTQKRDVITQSDADTVEQFINSHFGSAWDPESGATVEIVDDDFELDPNGEEPSGEVPAEKPAEKPKAAAKAAKKK